MSVSILTRCTQRPQRPFQVINMILQEKHNSIFNTRLKYPAMSGEDLLKRDCVVAKFNIEQKILAWSSSIKHHVPYSHDRGYPKYLTLKRLSVWLTYSCGEGYLQNWNREWDGVCPIETEWPLWNSSDTLAHQTLLECFCLIASILGLWGTWNVFCSHRFRFNCLIFLGLVLKSCLQLQ